MKNPVKSAYVRSVVTPDGIDLLDGAGLVVASITGSTPEAQRLIEAAPALLAALELALPYVEHRSEINKQTGWASGAESVVGVIRSVLASVKGVAR